MSKQRDWFKWKIGAGKRGTLRRASRRVGNGFEVVGACVAMLDHARAASHWIDNPEGVFTTSLEDLSIDYTVPVARVREVLGALVANGWLYASGDVALAADDDDIRFRVQRYLAFNDPQGSDSDRKAAQRERARLAENAAFIGISENSENDDNETEKTAILQGSVTGCHKVSVKSLEEKRREEKKKKDTSEKATPIADNALTKNIREVFDYWADATSTGRGRKPAFDAKRQARIRARLRDDKFTVTDLKACVDGFVASPWHNGTDTGKRWLGIETIFRDAAQVEKGIELAVARSNATAAQTTVGVDASVLYWIEKQIGRELSSAEDDALQRGSVSVDAFLAEHAPDVDAYFAPGVAQ